MRVEGGNLYLHLLREDLFGPPRVLGPATRLVVHLNLLAPPRPCVTVRPAVTPAYVPCDPAPRVATTPPPLPALPPVCSDKGAGSARTLFRASPVFAMAEDQVGRVGTLLDVMA